MIYYKYFLEDAVEWGKLVDDFNPIHFYPDDGGHAPIVHGMRVGHDLKSLILNKEHSKGDKKCVYDFSIAFKQPLKYDCDYKIIHNKTVNFSFIEGNAENNELVTYKFCSTEMSTHTDREMNFSGDRVDYIELQNFFDSYCSIFPSGMLFWDCFLFYKALNYLKCQFCINEHVANPYHLPNVFEVYRVYQTHQKLSFDSAFLLATPSHWQHKKIMAHCDYEWISGGRDEGGIICVTARILCDGYVMKSEIILKLNRVEHVCL
ncbi:hypothetical protein [Escherichia coli]|uniref:hypothetical protein n=1 Tax=Escherichia coli TaxID=562 RepID=UPI001FFEDAF8|nr:hypothetical protein [Escherichia coli]MCK2392802.1 hypothetical protein [Escherichia coli]MCZ7330989.1 hypothetical protein [Escherichia coli]